MINLTYWLAVLILFGAVDAVRSNQDTFGVLFNQPGTAHRILDSNVEKYDPDEMKILIETVATKFRILMIGEDSTYEESVLSHIPDAVANFNKLHLGDGGRAPLELILQFLPDSRGVMTYEVVKEWADSANSIFPNTVRTLLLSNASPVSGKPYVNSSQLLQLGGGDMSEYRKRAGGDDDAEFQYRLGSILSQEMCTSSSQLHTGSIISSSQTVFFMVLPSEEQVAAGVESAFPQFTQFFQSCKERVLGAHHPELLEVGFITGWPDTSSNGTQNVSSLVAFWRRMNRWSRSTSTKVMMLDAFDVRFYSSGRLDAEFWHEFPWATRGWWRLNESASSNLTHVSGFVIDEKLEDLIMQGELTAEEEPRFEDIIHDVVSDEEYIHVKKAEETGTPVWVVMVVVTTLALLIALGTGAVLVIFLLRKRSPSQPPTQSLLYIRETNELLAEFNLGDDAGDEQDQENE